MCEQVYCLTCFIQYCPDKPVFRNYKTKERATVEHVFNTHPDYDWIPDRQVQDGCSKKRPDLRLDLGSHVLMVEVDEKQHKPYGCSCDNKRTMLLSQDVGHRPLIFIRFNPDQYIDKDGTKVPSCWKHGKDGIIRIQNDKDWGFRLGVLSEQIEYWIENSTDKLVEVVELFYNGMVQVFLD